MRRLELWFEGGEQSLAVRSFSVQEGLSQLFDVSVRALSPKTDVDLEMIVGRKASFQIFTGLSLESAPPVRMWTGVCSQASLVAAETKGHSTYQVTIVPEMWLLSQRRGNRLFHDKDVVTIVEELLGEWKLTPQKKLAGSYPKLEMVVQYAETDLAFVSRLLEEAGITYGFTFDGNKTELWLYDEPHNGDSFRSFPYVDEPGRELGREFVTQVRLRHEVRPGKLTLRDHDFRRMPDAKVQAEAKMAEAPEDFYEQYRYRPGSFWVETKSGGAEPVADDQGKYRHDEATFGKDLAERSLQAVRRGREHVTFQTNSVAIWPGRIFTVADYPNPGLVDKVLCTSTWLAGTSEEQWTLGGEALFCQIPYRPEPKTAKPRIRGVQSAIVVGPPGQEIHTDEQARVRVQFHWDREGKYDEKSSGWMRVTESWAGAGFGTIHLPRIGQEVLVGFIDGDPDHPVVVGRVYNATTKVPYPLPDLATRSTWKSNSTPQASGFNEIMFEDAAGKELVYVQAQRDLQKLVKNAETQRTGANRSIIVGGDRSEVVGSVDSLLAGAKILLEVCEPPPNPMPDPPPKLAKPTKLEMIDKRVIYTTKEATLAIDDQNILLEAQGNITIKSKGGDVVIQGSTVWVNTRPAPPAPKPAEFSAHAPLNVQIQAPHAKAKLKAEAPKKSERVVNKEAAPPAPEPPKPAASITCVFKSATIHCQHDGRKPNDKGVLEVVPAEAFGDDITLIAKAVPSCGKHPEWVMSTPSGTETKQGGSATMRTRPWSVPDPRRWLSGVTPKQYSAWAKACSGESKHFIVKAYPKDALSIKWTPKDFAPAQAFTAAVQSFLQTFVNSNTKVKAAVGVGVVVEAQWTEYDDWRAFYKFTATVGFNPLFELTIRIPFGGTALIPSWLKKWVGELEFFLDFFGGLMIGMQFGRDQPGPPRLSGKLEGQVGARLGASFKLGPKGGRVIDVECYGESAIKGTAQPRYTDADGPYVELSVGCTGLTGNIKVAIWNGKIEKQFALQIFDEKTFKKGTWYLTKKSA